MVPLCQQCSPQTSPICKPLLAEPCRSVSAEHGPLGFSRLHFHGLGEADDALGPFDHRRVDHFAAERDDAKRKELMFEYNRIWTENVYSIGIVLGRYGLALAKRFENVPVGCPTFLYHWTWGNAAPEQVWVNPGDQLQQIQPGAIPTYAADYLD